MTDIYLVNDKNDYDWRCQTLRVLSKKVLNFKRDQRHHILTDSLGVLAYANSFKEISEESLRSNRNGKYIKNNNQLFPNFYVTNLEKSINASLESAKNKSQEKIRTIDLFRTLLISTIGLVVSFVALLSLSIDSIPVTPHPWSTYIATFIIKDPLMSVVFLGVVIFAGMVLFGAIDILSWEPVRGFVKIIQSYKKAAAVMIFTALSVLSLYGFIKSLNL